MLRLILLFPPFVAFFLFINIHSQAQQELIINDSEFLEMTGLNVMLAHDFYPEGHQGGVGIIHHGQRIATNGDLRLEPTPGQWQPVPQVGEREVNRELETISIRMTYPDPEKDKKGFNPIIYPDLNFSYYVRVQLLSRNQFKIIIDLEQPLPQEWIGKVGFNLELFPGILFGKSYLMDSQFGIFPLQPNGPMFLDTNQEVQIQPMAVGQKLVIAPENDLQRLAIESTKSKLELIDGRGKHNNGWFVVRALIPENATERAIEWVVTPHTIPHWKRQPVIQHSQVGYHPDQEKVVTIELDKNDSTHGEVTLTRLEPDGNHVLVYKLAPKLWGQFLRYQYLTFDFTPVKTEGMYQLSFRDYTSSPFQISSKVFNRHVWQPTLEYFLPVQMCHMRVQERYRVWHDFCHLDDALMAPTNTNHFDGYKQGPATLTHFQAGDPVPGLHVGGWHDAGDFDLRVESQAETVYGLSTLYEMLHPEYDNTTIDQKKQLVEIQVPDGKNDFLQQIEHGVLSLIGGYKNLGRFYRGIICPTLAQYVLLGDASAMTDNIISKNNNNEISPPKVPATPDDRLVFTEDNPKRAFQTAAGLAAASRALKTYNPLLAKQCLDIALETWNNGTINHNITRLSLAVELLRITGEKEYKEFLIAITPEIVKNIARTGAVVGPVLNLINHKKFKNDIREAVRDYLKVVEMEEKKNPFGVPYEPDIWGAGWKIQHFGAQQYLLHTYYPDIFSNKYMLKAMNFILGAHPGQNNASFASGVGSKSITVGYGLNRADWSYIPGGIGSGTALIRPDFPELLEWPFLWQQTEYVLGRGTTDYLLLTMAADHLLNRQ